MITASQEQRIEQAMAARRARMGPPLPAPIDPAPAPSGGSGWASRKLWVTVLGVIAELAILTPVLHLPAEVTAICTTVLIVAYVVVQGVADILTGDYQPIVPPPFIAAIRKRRKR